MYGDGASPHEWSAPSPPRGDIEPRQQTGAAEPVQLADVIRSVAELRQRRLESEGIELLIEDRSSNQVAAVMTELQQVVLAVPDRGSIERWLLGSVSKELILRAAGPVLVVRAQGAGV